MSAVYIVVEQIGHLDNGNVCETTVPRYSLTFHSSNELAEKQRAGAEHAWIVMRELDNVNSNLSIDPFE